MKFIAGTLFVASSVMKRLWKQSKRDSEFGGAPGGGVESQVSFCVMALSPM